MRVRHPDGTVSDILYITILPYVNYQTFPPVVYQTWASIRSWGGRTETITLDGLEVLQDDIVVKDHRSWKQGPEPV